MEVIYSSAEVPPRDRFDRWHSIARSRFVEPDCRAEDPLNFQAQLEVGFLSNLELLQSSNSPMHIVYSGGARSDSLLVCYQVSGTVLMLLNGRDVAREAGTLSVLDPRFPSELQILRDSKALILKVPRRELQSRIGWNPEMMGRLVKPGRTDDDLTLSLTKKLPSLVGQIEPSTEEFVGNLVLDLVGFSIARTMAEARVSVSSQKAFVLSRIRAVIEARLADPSLGARAVADAAGTSVRYANNLLAQQDTSIKRLMLERRLSRCRSSLQDPNQIQRTVSEIAYGWGFSDMTHFGRRFKEAYGILPSAYRILASRARKRSSPGND
jgi:AraC-like DNA-binding protein